MKFARQGAYAALAIASALSAMPAAAQGDTEAGMEKANTCMGCHGIPGYNNAYPTYRVPKISGQPAQYLEIALKAYRSGERPHATMHAQAASMSDQDIADIAAYLATAPAK
ncbi:c-type cytochrome [Panacagrimonas sp.]|uniref:c-type cytochrome n=1 Tax=Panacagrimonas sp. TaxID=2480088 RepID=UPI003B517B61